MRRSHTIQSALLWCILTLVAPLSWAADQGALSESERDGTKAPSEKHSTVGRTAQEKAKDAKARAGGASKSGKKLVAQRLEKVASIWEKVALHQKRAAQLEKEAAQIERDTLDLKSKARRAHSLVEQTETRRARALARLRELGLSDVPKEKPRSESGTESSPSDTQTAPADSKAGSK